MFDPRLEQILVEVATYVETDDWLELKKVIVKMCPAEIRGMFSKRHPITKRQQTNDFEREVAARWSELTGRVVVFTKQHEEK